MKSGILRPDKPWGVRTRTEWRSGPVLAVANGLTDMTVMTVMVIIISMEFC